MCPILLDQVIVHGYFVNDSSDLALKNEWDLIREALYTKLMFSIDDFKQKATLKRIIRAYFLFKFQDQKNDIDTVVDGIRFLNDSQFMSEIIKSISNTKEHCSFYSGVYDSLVIYGWIEEIDKSALTELKNEMTKGNYYLDYIPDKRYKTTDPSKKRGVLIGLFSYCKTNKRSDKEAKEKLLTLVPNLLVSYTPDQDLNTRQLLLF